MTDGAESVGLLLSIRGKAVQISTAPGAIDECADVLVSIVRVVAKGSADHSPKTKDGSHPVFKLGELRSWAARSCGIRAIKEVPWFSRAWSPPLTILDMTNPTACCLSPVGSLPGW